MRRALGKYDWDADTALVIYVFQDPLVKRCNASLGRHFEPLLLHPVAFEPPPADARVAHPGRRRAGPTCSRVQDPRGIAHVPLAAAAVCLEPGL